MTKFLTPKLRVQLESPGTDELTEYIVQTDNRDMVAFDLTRSRKGWPSMDEANMFWMTFLAHHALSKRGGVAITFEDFLDRAVIITPVDEDGEEVALEDSGSADPLLSEASGGY